MREFHKFNPALWKNPIFRKSTSDREKLALLYLATNHHQTMLGSYYIPDTYAANDLGWTLVQYREARQKLQELDFILYDDSSEEVFVTDWFATNLPDNGKHYLGVLNQLRKIQSKKLNDAIVIRLRKALEEKGPPKWFDDLECKGLVAELADEKYF
jgi:hypothetical protein